MGFLTLAFLPFGIGFAFYLYFFFKRTFVTFGYPLQRKGKIILAVLVSLVASTTLSISSFTLIILLHLMALSLLVRLVNFILKKFFKKRYGDGFCFWKRVYGCGVIPLVLTALILLGGYINMHNVVATRYTVYTEKGIRTEGYRVALLADLHFGVSLDAEELAKVCRDVSKENADIVVLCGDIVDNDTTKKEMQTAFQLLGGIENKLGIYYVYGNHDRSNKMLRSEFTNAQLQEAITASGITILQDESVMLNEDILLVGREDRSNMHGGKTRLSIASLLDGVDPSRFVLTLDHQPNEYRENAEAGSDLVLSGHTHGGQLFPVNLLLRLIPFNDALYGRYRIDDSTEAIVTSGIAGWAYPVKTAASAEYVVIDILPK